MDRFCHCIACAHSWSEKDFSLEKRLIFDNETGAAAPRAEMFTPPGVEDREQRPTGLSQLQQWRLDNLSAEVRRSNTEAELANLKARIEQGQEMLRQEQETVQGLQNQIPGLAEQSETNKENFFAQVEARTTVLLTMLVRSGQIDGQELMRDPAAALTQLGARQSELRVRSHGERTRALLPQESAMFSINNDLKNHPNADIKDRWRGLSTELTRNVRAMNFATDLVTAGRGGEGTPAAAPTPSPTGGGRLEGSAAPAAGGAESAVNAENAEDGERGGLLAQISDAFSEMSGPQKAIVAGAAAVGIMGAIWAIKSIFESNSGAMGKVAGSGAVALALAGGFVIGAEMMGVDVWDEIKGMFPDLSQVGFLAGFSALTSGATDRARDLLGPAYNRVREMLGMRPDSGGGTESSEETGPTSTEVGGETIEMVPAREAISNYMEDLRDQLSPVTSYIRQHEGFFKSVAAYVGITNFSLVTGGLTATAGSFLSFAKILAVAVPAHPITSLMAVSACMMAKPNFDSLRLPSNIDNLTAYISGTASEIGTELQTFGQNAFGLAQFLAFHGMDAVVPSNENLHLAARVLKNQVDINEVYEGLENFGREFYRGGMELMEITPEELVKDRNSKGMDFFLDQLRQIRGNNPSPELSALFTHVQDLGNQLRTPEGALTEGQIGDLGRIALAAGIRIEERADGYIWWGQIVNGEYVDPNRVFCLGVNPSMPAERQSELASRFVSNPNNLLSDVALTALYERPLEDLRNLIPSMAEAIQSDNGTLIVQETGSYFYDAALHKYFALPRAIVDQVINHARTGQGFSAKELLFQYGEGLVPVMVLGGVQSLASFRLPMRGGVLRAVAETMAYPVTGTIDTLAFANTRLIRPFRQGLNEGTGLANRMVNAYNQVKNFNIGRFNEFLSRVGGRMSYLSNRVRGTEVADLIGRQDTLRNALLRLRSAEDVGTGLGRGLLSTSRIKQAQTILKNGNLSYIADMINTGDAQAASRLINEALSYHDDLIRATESLSALKNGVSMGLEELQLMQRLASNATFREGFKNMLRAAEVGAENIDEVIDILRTGTRVEEVAEVFGRAGLAGAEGARIFRISRIATDAAETLALLKMGEAINPERLNFLRRLATDGARVEEFTAALKSVGVEGEAAVSAVRAALQGETNLARLTQVFSEVGLIDDAAREAGMFRRALDALRNGKDISVNGLKAIREALLAVPGSPRYQTMMDTIRSLPGFAQETFNRVVEAFRNSTRVSDLVERLRPSGWFSWSREVVAAAEAGETVQDVIAAGRSASWLEEGARATSFMDEIAEGTRATSFMDEAGDVARAGLFAEAAGEASDATRLSSNIAEAVGDSRAALESAIDLIRTGGELNLDHIGALKEAAKAGDEFSDLLRGAGMAEGEVATVARLLAEESDLVRIADGLGATEALRVGEGVAGLSRIAKFMKAIPVVGAIASAGGSIFESWHAFAMAREVENNPQLRSILYDKSMASAGLGVASLTLDIGLIAAEFGSTAASGALTAFKGALGATGVGLILIAGIEAVKYMVNGALDARAETMKGYDAWTAEAMSRAQVQADIDLPTAEIEQAYRAILNGEVIGHAELAVLREEAIDDPEDLISELVEEAEMSQGNAEILVRGLVALSVIVPRQTAERDEEAIDDAVDLLEDTGMEEEAARSLIQNYRSSSKTTNQVLAEVGLEFTSEPRLTDVQSERVMREARSILVREWLVTGRDAKSVGQTYDIAFNSTANFFTGGWLGHGGSEFYENANSFTRAKLVQALVQTDSPGKNQNYIRLRIKYIQSRTEDLNIDSFAQGTGLLAMSKVAADVLSNRVGPDGRGKTMMLGNPPVETDLSHDDYDPERITPENVKAVFDAFKNQQATEMTELLGQGIFDRIKDLDPNYLNYAAGALMSHVAANGENISSNPQLAELANIASHIGLYLQAKGYPFSPPRDEVDPNDLNLITRMFTDESLNQDQVYESLGPYKLTNRDNAAMYSLARYWGYNGSPNPRLVERYFSTEGRGVRYDKDDEQWVVNVEYGVDRDVEPEEGESLSSAMIKLLREHKNNVLANRNNAAMDGLRVGIRDDEARLQNTVDEMVAALMRGSDAVREKDIIEQTGTHLQQSVLGGAASGFAEGWNEGVDNLEETYNDAQEGTQVIADAIVAGDTTGLEMAAAEANDRAVDALDSVTGGRYSSTVNSLREEARSIPLIGGIF